MSSFTCGSSVQNDMVVNYKMIRIEWDSQGKKNNTIEVGPSPNSGGDEG